MKEKFNEKVIPVILKFINTKAIQSIKNGMVTSMSPLIIGSIFLILSNFPVKAVVDVLESTGIKPVLDQVCGATFSISALIAVIVSAIAMRNWKIRNHSTVELFHWQHS